MAVFGIIDPNKALEQADKFSNYGQGLANEVTELHDIISVTQSAWESDTNDATSFVKALQKDLENLTEIYKAIVALGVGLRSVAYNAKIEQSKTID